MLSITALGAQDIYSDSQIQAGFESSQQAGASYSDMRQELNFNLMQREDLNEAKVYAVSNEIFISLKATSDIGVYDITGKCIATYKDQNGDLRITVKSGMYIVKVTSGDKSKAFKVIVR